MRLCGGWGRGDVEVGAASEAGGVRAAFVICRHKGQGVKNVSPALPSFAQGHSSVEQKRVVERSFGQNCSSHSVSTTLVRQGGARDCHFTAKRGGAGANKGAYNQRLKTCQALTLAATAIGCFAALLGRVSTRTPPEHGGAPAGGVRVVERPVRRTSIRRGKGAKTSHSFDKNNNKR